MYLGKSCDELRLLYWQKVREGIPMESIWYDNIPVQYTDDPSSALDSDDDSDQELSEEDE